MQQHRKENASGKGCRSCSPGKRGRKDKWEEAGFLQQRLGRPRGPGLAMPSKAHQEFCPRLKKKASAAAMQCHRWDLQSVSSVQAGVQAGESVGQIQTAGTSRAAGRTGV